MKKSKMKKSKSNKKHGMSTGGKVAIGAGLAVASAGAYYFLGPKGKVHQKKTKAWAVKMEKELKQDIKKVKNVTVPIYHEVVDSLAKKYAKEYSAHKGDIDVFAKALKKNWKQVEKASKPAIKKVRRAVRKATK